MRRCTCSIGSILQRFTTKLVALICFTKWVAIPSSFNKRKTLAVVIVLQRDLPVSSLRRSPSPAVIWSLLTI